MNFFFEFFVFCGEKKTKKKSCASSSCMGQ